jgi:hypothetical protein
MADGLIESSYWLLFMLGIKNCVEFNIDDCLENRGGVKDSQYNIR